MYTILWLESGGIVQELERDDYAAAVRLAKCLDDWFCGVEALDETGRPVWPSRTPSGSMVMACGKTREEALEKARWAEPEPA